MNGFKEWHEENRYELTTPNVDLEMAYEAGRSDRQQQDAQIAAGDAITPGCTMLEIAKAIRAAE